MKIEFVSKGEVGELQEREGELILFSMEGMQEVSYEKELKGETNYFEKGARLSKKREGVVVCGCLTDTRGYKRKSAFVAQDGKILGVSDALHVLDGEASPGGSLRVYETKLGRMGVVVAEDLFFPEVIQSLALCGSDFIVCIFGKGDLERLQSILRAYASLYGVPLCFCGVGDCMIVDCNALTFSSSESPVITEFTPTKEYHLVETRRRGIFEKA